MIGGALTRILLRAIAMAAAFFFLLLLLSLFLFWKKAQKKTCAAAAAREAPEPGGAWPILGHIPLLLGKAPAHRTIADLADRYGPLITLRIGRRRLLVVSSADMARECFTSNDRALGSRPCTAVGRHIGFDFASFGLSPAGPLWRHTRRLAVQELLSPRRLDSLRHIWVSEIDSLVKELHGLTCMDPHASPTVGLGTAPVVVDVKGKLWALSFNVITRLVAGKRHCGAGVDSDQARRFRRVAGEVLRLLSVPSVGDAFPWLKWLDFRYEMDLRKAAMEVDSIMQEWLEEHLINQGSSSDGEEEEGGGGVGVKKRSSDFMEVLIWLGKSGHLQYESHHHSVETVIKATAFVS